MREKIIETASTDKCKAKKIARNRVMENGEATNRKMCTKCGGRGEVVNMNHYFADLNEENKYVVCDACCGIGSILFDEYDSDNRI